ncbi:MAG: phage virion morphogenesis protein [Methylotenera sp.]|nr:phage virion morphogenesis protein [Methylotenera sp.]
MQYTIEFQDHHLKQVLKVVAAEIATPQQMLGSIGESLLRVNKDRHSAGLAPDGTKWESLAESTLKEKRKGDILNKTGEMLQSFNYQVDDDSLRLGFDGARNNQLATWHHGGTEPYLIEPLNKKALYFGGRFAKKVKHPGLPERQLVGFPISDQQLTAHVVEDHLMMAINNI